MTVGKHAADLVELADHGLALEPAAAGGVPGAEDLHGAFQRVDLLGADGRRLVAVEADLVVAVRRFEAGDGERIGVCRGTGARCRVGVQPVVHGAGQRGACGERRARAHQTASVEHEVHSREFREDRGGPLGSPRQPVVGLPPPRTAAPGEPEVLGGYDTAEALGEQRGQHLRHRISGGLPHVDPAPHPRGVGRQLRMAHGRRLPVDQSRQFALGPSGQSEKVRETGVRLPAHVKPPGSSTALTLTAVDMGCEHSPGVRQGAPHGLPPAPVCCVDVSPPARWRDRIPQGASPAPGARRTGLLHEVRPAGSRHRAGSAPLVGARRDPSHPCTQHRPP